MVFFHPKKSPYADLRPQPCSPPILSPRRAPVPQNNNRQHIAPTYKPVNNQVVIRDSIDDSKSEGASSTSATDSGLVWQVDGRRSPRIAISPTTSTAASAQQQQQDFRTPNLSALQAEGPDNGDAHLVEPISEDDPRSFDLVPATTGGPQRGYNIEERAALLLGGRHLQTIFDDPRLYKNFVSWIQTYRPGSIPRLTIYRQAMKAIQAIKYSNAITSSMMPVEGRPFTEDKIEETVFPHLEELAKRAFDELVAEDFPAYICSIWIPIISATVHQRINGALPDSLKQASEGLAEVFCLTDPRQKDDPIVLASKEFTTTTQYGMNFICGQNCRFLQGSGTDPEAIRRVRTALKAQREHSELFLNYRRDGSPFMNLCLLVPLTDFDGNLKYYLGAQVDVSGLLRSCAGFESFARTVRDTQDEADGDFEDRRSIMTATANMSAAGPEFRGFAEMLDGVELNTVRRFGGAMHKGEEVVAYDDEDDYYRGGRRRGLSDTASISSMVSDRPRMLLVDRNEAAWSSRNVRAHRIGGGTYGDAPSPNRAAPPQRSAEELQMKMSRQLDTMYKDFLLVRPAPSFNITFTSATMRDEDVLQTEFFQHIGGSVRVRDGLKDALSQGHKVTAKVRWSSRYRRKGGFGGGGFGPSESSSNKLPTTPTRMYASSGGSGHNNNNSGGGFYGNGHGSGFHNGRGKSPATMANADEGFWIDTPTDFASHHHHPSHHPPPPPSRGSRKDEVEGELRWIHCTPLVDASGRIGVWVIMLIDE